MIEATTGAARFEIAGDLDSAPDCGETKKDTKDAILFNAVVSAGGGVNEQARKYTSPPRSSQQVCDFDEDED